MLHAPFIAGRGSKFQTYRGAELELAGHVDRLPTCSSCLSDYFLPGFVLGLRRWRELFDLGDFGRWLPCEQIFEVIKRVDAMPPTTSQQGVNYRTPSSSILMP
jgi:hypothetical protein